MSTPSISEVLDRKRAQIAAKRHELELLEAEMRGMEEMAALFPRAEPTLYPQGNLRIPTTIGPHQPSGARSSGGRQPGAISNKWKRHLLVLSESGRFSGEDVASVVEEREGRIMRPSEVKRLFEKYVDQGHVRLISPDLYEVPSQTANKFRISLQHEPEDNNDGEDQIDVPSPEAVIQSQSKIRSVNFDLDDISEQRPTTSDTSKYDMDDDIPF